MLHRANQVTQHLTTTTMAPKTPNIHLYTAQTPNGIKISILLEELGLPYTTHAINISKNEQKTPDFLEINPNGRIPALTDTFTDGQTIRLFESGSIMQYLIEQYDQEKHRLSYPQGSREYYEVNSWLFFMNAGVGPMQVFVSHLVSAKLGIASLIGREFMLTPGGNIRAKQTTSPGMRQRRSRTESLDTRTRREDCTACWTNT